MSAAGSSAWAWNSVVALKHNPLRVNKGDASNIKSNFFNNKTWSVVSNSSLSKTCALCQFRKLKVYFLPPNIILGLKKMSPKYYFGSEKIWSGKKLWSKKKFGVQKNFGSELNFVRNFFLGPKEILGLKKNLGLKKILSLEKFWVQKKLCPKKILDPKILGPKKI